VCANCTQEKCAQHATIKVIALKSALSAVTLALDLTILRVCAASAI